MGLIAAKKGPPRIASLLQLAQSPVSDDPSHPLTDPNLGTVPMCCDVGMLRDEDGTPFRCDFDG